MMQRNIWRHRRFGALLMLNAALWGIAGWLSPPAASAQAISGFDGKYSLPPATATPKPAPPSPPLQGPTNKPGEAIKPLPVVPTPALTPPPAPSASRAPVSAPRKALPPEPAAPAPRRAVPTKPLAHAAPAAQATATPPPALLPLPLPAMTRAAKAAFPPSPRAATLPWLTIAGGVACGAALIAGLAGLHALRRRRRTPKLPPPAARDIAPNAGQPAPEPPASRDPLATRFAPLPQYQLADAEPEPRPAPPPPAVPAAAPPSPAPPELVAFELIPTRLDISLMTATLRYQLRLTNPGAEPLGPIKIAADMIAAHASRRSQDQLGTAETPLPDCHSLEALAAGAAQDVAGELRLPLSAITPIRAGSAALFVPLVRLRIAAARAGGSAHSLIVSLVLGEPPAAQGGGIRPFRLDLGPRSHTALAVRRIG